MKKINIFNRNINSPSYRRMPVSSGIVENRHTAEARCPGIAIAMTCPAGDFSSQGDEKHNVCDASFCIRKNWVPAFAGMTIIVIAALFATPSFAAPTELDKKTVASKAYVDTKQDKIPATTSELYNISHAGSLVATTGSDGIVQERLIVPGFNALAGELGAILNQWNSLGGDNESLATMLTDLYLDYTGEDIAYNPLYSIPSLELISDLYNQMYYEFSTTLENATTGTPNNVAMYDNDGILADSRPTANAPTYNETTGVLENGTNIATIAAVNTRQKKMTCAGWDSETHTEEHCWLWNIE